MTFWAAPITCLFSLPSPPLLETDLGVPCRSRSFCSCCRFIPGWGKAEDSGARGWPSQQYKRSPAGEEGGPGSTEHSIPFPSSGRARCLGARGQKGGAGSSVPFRDRLPLRLEVPPGRLKALASLSSPSRARPEAGWLAGSSGRALSLPRCGRPGGGGSATAKSSWKAAEARQRAPLSEPSFASSKCRRPTPPSAGRPGMTRRRRRRMLALLSLACGGEDRPEEGKGGGRSPLARSGCPALGSRLLPSLEVTSPANLLLPLEEETEEEE